MSFMRFCGRIVDFCLTVFLWVYFLFGYLFILLFLFIPSYLRLKSSAAVLQKMNHIHLRIFFAWLGFLAPRTKVRVGADVRNLRSSIIVCNHVSYLDPILLVSLYPRQTTIVKSTFFSVPIFGWFLKKAGYVPSATSELFSPAMMIHLEGIRRHLAAGGNLFVFPEGTRSTPGRIAPFHKGAFSIARYCNAELQLVLIRNTDQLFPPGSFSFHMLGENTLSLELIASLAPDYQADDFSAADLADQAREIFRRHIAHR